MGIYSNAVETSLKNIFCQENRLQEFDNYTYNIQMFMIPVKKYSEYCLLKNKNPTIYEVEKFLNQHKVILFETGKTNNYSLTSLTIKGVPPTGQDTGLTTISMDMNIEEIGGCSLMNKLALTSYVCGYESYMYQPYFISIWFSGYDRVTGKPVKKIDNTVYTYNVVMNVSSSMMEMNKTSYKMLLFPYFYNSLSKEVNPLNDIGSVKLNIQEDISTIVSELEEKINEKLQHQYGEYVIKKLYHNRYPVKIIFDEESFKSATVETPDGRKIKKDMRKWKTAFQQVYEGARDKISKSKWNMVPGAIAVTGTALAILKGMQWGAGGTSQTLTPETSSTIPSLLTQISHIYNQAYLGYVWTYVYKINLVGQHAGKIYYEHNIEIHLEEIPGLKNNVTRAMNFANNIKKNTVEKYYKSLSPLEQAELDQLDFLEYALSTGIINKKYSWILNGENTSVLNVQRSDNNLWYLNAGLSNFYNVFVNEKEDNFYIDDKKALTEQNYNYVTKNITSISEIENKKYNFKAKDGYIYMDDIYDILYGKDEFKNGITSYYNIAEANDPIMTIKPITSSDKTGTDDESTKNKNEDVAISQVSDEIGVANVFQWGGQRLTVDMDIIGDPYWLECGSEGYNTLNLDRNLYPNIILDLKSFYSSDRYDKPREDKLMNITTVYTITEIDNMFEGGKFTQKLKGYVPLPFLQATSKKERLKTNNPTTTSLRTKEVNSK